MVQILSTSCVDQKNWRKLAQIKVFCVSVNLNNPARLVGFVNRFCCSFYQLLTRAYQKQSADLSHIASPPI